MGALQTIKELEILATNTRMTNMVSFGDIREYDNKATIKYPYINLDIVTSNIQNYAKTYTIRVYVCDRNTPYVAYNKAETILNEFLKSPDLDVQSYTVNYFSYNFQDSVHGVWADFTFTVPLQVECRTIDYPLNFILQENGDYIKIEDIDGFIEQEEIQIIK